MTPRMISATALCGALVVVAGCNRSTPPVGETQRRAEEWTAHEKLKDGDIDDIDIGRTLTASGDIGDKTRHFAAGEPVYVAVDTQHIDTGTTVTAVLRQKEGLILAQETITVTGKDPRFHIEKSDGLPVGDYTVEVHLSSGNGVEQSFKVR